MHGVDFEGDIGTESKGMGFWASLEGARAGGCGGVTRVSAFNWWLPAVLRLPMSLEQLAGASCTCSGHL